MSKRDDFQKTMEENLALWGARLDAVKAKLTADTAQAPPEAQHAAVTKVAEWRARGDAVIGKIEVLKNTRGDDWDVLKVEVQSAWEELEAAMLTAEQELRTFDDEQNLPAAPIAVPVAAVSAPSPAPASKPA